MKKALVLLALALPAAAHAQGNAPDPVPANPGVSAAQQTWQIMTRYFTMAAEELSEADYAYKPVESVLLDKAEATITSGSDHDWKLTTMSR